MSFPRYPAYKPSGVEWLGEVPEHWEALPLRRLIRQVSSGTSVNAIDEPASPGQAGVLKTSCVYTGEFRPEENKAILESELDRATCPVMAGSLVVSRMNTPDLVGAAGLVKNNDPFLFLPDRLWLVSFQDCDPQFMNYWCKSVSYRSQVQLACSGTSSSMQNLSQDNFYSFIAPLSPTGEQSAIATFLDHETAKIDALIAEQQRLIELLQEKRQAVISHAVTKGLNPAAPMKDSGVEWLGEVPEHWNVTKLKRLSTAKCDGPFGSGLKSEHYRDNGVFVVRLQNIKQNILDLDTRAFIDKQYYREELGDHDVIQGDVLIAGLGDDNNLVGRACVAPVEVEPAMVKADCFRFRLDTQHVEPEFAAFSLNASARYHGGKMSSGSTRARIPLGQMGEREIVIPSLEEQRTTLKQLERELEEFRLLCESASQAISLLQERRSALISAAVTGQIDVRSLTPEASEQ